jgi:hypothetical protein
MAIVGRSKEEWYRRIGIEVLSYGVQGRLNDEWRETRSKARISSTPKYSAGWAQRAGTYVTEEGTSCKGS